MSGADPTRRPRDGRTFGMVTQMAPNHGRVTPPDADPVTDSHITGVSSIDERAATPTLTRLRDAARRYALTQADLDSERDRALAEGHSLAEMAAAVNVGYRWPGVPR